MVGDVQRQGRLAHARPGRQDDQFRVVETPGEGIQVGKAAGNARRPAMFQPLIDLRERLEENFVDAAHLVGASAVVDGEDLLLGLGEHLAGL